MQAPAIRPFTWHAEVMRVLLVEDDESIANPLCDGLARYGFTVERASTGAAALAAGPVDMVLLDLGLPDMDGIDVCRAIRARSAVPVIMITARGEETDRVLGLELGADDYLAKPFGLRELVARIREVTRRAQASPLPAGGAELSSGGINPAAGAAAGPQRLGPVSIDRRTRQVTSGGQPVALAPKEFDLLAMLAEDPGAVYTRQQILDTVWDPQFFGPTKTLDVHIAALRRKLGDPAWIETVRGVGFRLVIGQPSEAGQR